MHKACVAPVLVAAMLASVASAAICPAVSSIRYGACGGVGSGNCYVDQADPAWNSNNAAALGGGLLFPTTVSNTLPNQFSRAYIYNAKLAANGVVCQYYVPGGSGLKGLISVSNYQLFSSPAYSPPKPLGHSQFWW